MKVNKAITVVAPKATPSRTVKASVQTPVAKVKAAVKSAAEKTISFLYKHLEGTWLYAPCVRKEDMKGNPLVDEPGSKNVANKVVLVVGSRQGQCVSVGPVTAAGVAVLNHQLGVDTTKFAQVKVLSLKDAQALARKEGKPCTIEHQGKNMSGYLVGNLAQMYVWFSTGNNLISLDTKRISDGRNKTRLFKLVAAK